MNINSGRSDTSAEAFAVQRDLLRATAPIDRLRKSMALSRQVKQMALNAIRRRHGEFDELAVRHKFIEMVYGKSLADAVRSFQKGLMVE